MENIEKWKRVWGYANYEVSTLGKVRKNGKEVKQCKHNKGYYTVDLYKDGERKRFFVHRLVAETFLPNPDNKPQVNHLNRNREDNRVENLEWVTPTENMNSPLTRKHCKEVMKGENTSMYGKFGKEHHLSKTVIQFDLDGNMLNVWNALMDAEREVGARNGHISNCCRGKQQTSGGYKWQYQDEYLADWWDIEMVK